jgi:hypothetical protein
LARWMARATETERRRLTEWTANWSWVPHDLDPDLLRFANDLGIDTWDAELEPIKHELRAGFLDELKNVRGEGDEATASVPAASPGSAPAATPSPVPVPAPSPAPTPGPPRHGENGSTPAVG